MQPAVRRGARDSRCVHTCTHAFRRRGAGSADACGDSPGRCWRAPLECRVAGRPPAAGTERAGPILSGPCHDPGLASVSRRPTRTPGRTIGCLCALPARRHAAIEDGGGGGGRSVLPPLLSRSLHAVAAAAGEAAATGRRPPVALMESAARAARGGGTRTHGGRAATRWVARVPPPARRGVGADRSTAVQLMCGT